jgi:hypothetical protein
LQPVLFNAANLVRFIFVQNCFIISEHYIGRTNGNQSASIFCFFPKKYAIKTRESMEYYVFRILVSLNPSFQDSAKASLRAQHCIIPIVSEAN